MAGLGLSLRMLLMRGAHGGLPVPPDGYALLMLNGSYVTLDGFHLAVPAP
ncbi:hypothetical protein [Terrihabitans sp. B22-R8]